MDKEVTELLHQISSGDKNSIEKLFFIVYDKLRLLAQSQLNKEYHQITLQQTELVHEAFLKMVDQNSISANDRSHFYGIASKCMRQILVDHARKKNAVKRGGANFDATFDEEALLNVQANRVIEIDRLLHDLSNLDQRMASIVEYKFFGGLKNPQIAEILDISEKTVTRDWQHAKGWLYQRIREEGVS
jgi:RNA polymerase sigma factor (TIGR02999 family)